MKYIFSFIVAFLALTYNVFGQNTDQKLNGQVSFVTSQNIYVRFVDTEAITVGDSLMLAANNMSCLIVKSKSTTSCVCEIVEGCSIQKGDEVLYQVVPKVQEKEVVKKEVLLPVIDDVTAEPLYKETIRGRVSASSQSVIASERDNRHRLMGRLSISADHIKNSKFSFNTYMNYRQILDAGETSSLQDNSILRIYNFGVRYNATPTLSLTQSENIVIGGNRWASGRKIF